jgi:predicted outer membrane repeat protein
MLLWVLMLSLSAPGEASPAVTARKNDRTLDAPVQLDTLAPQTKDAESTPGGLSYSESASEQHRQFADVEVHNWTQANTSIAAIVSGSVGTVTLALDFDCGDYTSEIVISGNVTVHGNGGTCNAQEQGRFFVVTARALLTLESLTLTRGKGRYGGAIYSKKGAVLNVNGTTFEKNNASVGGAIYNEGTLNVNSSNFSFNHVRYSGGAVANGDPYDHSPGGTVNINNTTWKGNSASNGGGLNNEQGALTLGNSHFLSNRAVRGGAIESSGNLTTDGTNIFDQNTAHHDGGAIYLNSGTLSHINGGTFNGNSAIIGGAILNGVPGKSSTLHLNNSNFDSNSARNAGGAIMHLADGKLAVNNSLFVRNHANGYGGAISNSAVSLLGGVMDINRSTFIFNHAIFNGGAIFNRAGSLTVGIGSNFTGNTGRNGGAVAISAAGEVPVVTRFNGTTFAHNNASMGNGGALICSGSAKLDLFVSHCKFENNQAKTNGGAISVQQSESNIPVNLQIDCHAHLPNSEVDTTTVPTQRCRASGTNPGQCSCESCGGCIECVTGQCYGYWSPILNNCSASPRGKHDIQRAEQCPISTCFAPTNSSLGSVFREHNYSSKLVELKDLGFFHNDAEMEAGGAIHLVNVNASIHTATLVGNTAKVGGGAIFLGGTSSMALQGQSHITNSSVVNGTGSAIYSSSTGNIYFGHGTLVDISGSTSGLALLSSGNFSYDPRAKVVCGVNEQLRNQIIAVQQQENDWKINCSIPTVNEQNSVTCSSAACDVWFHPFDNGIPESCRDIRPLMSYFTGSAGCRSCGAGTYSLHQGALVGGESQPVECHTCPFGGDCATHSQPQAKTGFWGHSVDSFDGSEEQKLQFLLCPGGYCCHSNSHIEPNCAWNTSTACQKHRDHRTPLCGGCQSGFSLVLDGSGCVEDSECGQQEAAVKFAASQLFSWVCLCALFLYQGRYAPLVNRLPSKLRPSGENDGAVSALIYFYQLASIVVPLGKANLASQASRSFCVLSSAAGTSQLSDWVGCTTAKNDVAGFCAQRGLHFVTIRLWDLSVPLLLLALLYSIHVVPHQRTERQVASRGSLLEELLPDGAQIEDPVPDSQELQGVIQNQQLPVRGSSNDPEPSLNTRISPAVASMLLYCYGGVTSAVFELLYCVDVCTSPGNSETCSSVLFYSGNTECAMRWQLPIWILLAVIVMFPALTVIVWVLQESFVKPWKIARCLRSTGSRIGSTAVARKFADSAVVRALGASVNEPFKAEHWHWAALLVLQRLLMVSVGNFVKISTAVSVGMSFVSACFLLVHVYAKPYKHQHANVTQTIASLCLLGITILNSVPSGFASSGFDPVGTPLDGLDVAVRTIMFVLLLIPLAVWAILVVLQRSNSNSSQAATLTDEESPVSGNLTREVLVGQQLTQSTFAQEESTESRITGELFAAKQTERRLELEISRLNEQASAHREQIARLQGENAQLVAQCDM